MTSAFVIYNDIKTADEKNLTAWNCQKQTIFRLKTNGLNINANELLPGRWILVDFSSGSEPCILRICEEQEHKLLDTRIRDNIFEVRTIVTFFPDKKFPETLAYSPTVGRVGNVLHNDLKKHRFYFAWISLFDDCRRPQYKSLFKRMNAEWFISELEELPNAKLNKNTLDPLLGPTTPEVVKGIVVAKQKDVIPKVFYQSVDGKGRVSEVISDGTYDLALGKWVRFVPLNNFLGISVAVSHYPLSDQRGFNVLATSPDLLLSVANFKMCPNGVVEVPGISQDIFHEKGADVSSRAKITLKFVHALSRWVITDSDDELAFNNKAPSTTMVVKPPAKGKLSPVENYQPQSQDKSENELAATKPSSSVDDKMSTENAASFIQPPPGFDEPSRPQQEEIQSGWPYQTGSWERPTSTKSSFEATQDKRNEASNSHFTRAETHDQSDVHTREFNQTEFRNNRKEDAMNGSVDDFCSSNKTFSPSGFDSNNVAQPKAKPPTWGPSEFPKSSTSAESQPKTFAVFDKPSIQVKPTTHVQPSTPVTKQVPPPLNHSWGTTNTWADVDSTAGPSRQTQSESRPQSDSRSQTSTNPFRKKKYGPLPPQKKAFQNNWPADKKWPPQSNSRRPQQRHRAAPVQQQYKNLFGIVCRKAEDHFKVSCPTFPKIECTLLPSAEGYTSEGGEVKIGTWLEFDNPTLNANTVDITSYRTTRPAFTTEVYSYTNPTSGQEVVVPLVTVKLFPPSRISNQPFCSLGNATNSPARTGAPFNFQPGLMETNELYYKSEFFEDCYDRQRQILAEMGGTTVEAVLAYRQKDKDGPQSSWEWIIDKVLNYK